MTEQQPPEHIDPPASSGDDHAPSADQAPEDASSSADQSAAAADFGDDPLGAVLGAGSHVGEPAIASADEVAFEGEQVIASPVEVASEAADESEVLADVIEIRPNAADPDVLSDGHLELGEDGWLGSPAWAATVRWFFCALLVGVGAVFAFNAYVDPNGITGSKRYQIVLFDGLNRAAKVELMSRVEHPPKVLILGSSTSRNADPKTVEELTGASAFNAGMSAGMPVDMYAMASYAYNIWSSSPPHIVYLVDVDTTLSPTSANAGLLTTPELWTQFSRTDKARIARDAYRPYLTRDALMNSLRSVQAGTPYSNLVVNTVTHFRPDGYRRRDPFAHANAAKRREAETRRYRESIYRNNGAEQLDSVGEDFLTRIVALAAAHDQKPTFVVMPPHPAYRAAMRRDGYERRRIAVLRFLHTLRADGRAQVVDMTNLHSFGGDPMLYSDNVHMTQPNVDRMLDKLNELGVLYPLELRR